MHTTRKPLLHNDKSSLGRKCICNYRSEVGMLSYLLVTTRPEISMAINQCARVCNYPHLVHKLTIRHITNYLTSTSTYVYLPDWNWRLTTLGVVYRHNIEKVAEYYVDFDFASWWAQAYADNAENFMPCTWYVITYAVFPVLWWCKSQTEIYLSTPEAEYIALNKAMRKVILLMEFMEEVSFIFDVHLPKP